MPLRFTKTSRLLPRIFTISNRVGLICQNKKGSLSGDPFLLRCGGRRHPGSRRRFLSIRIPQKIIPGIYGVAAIVGVCPCLIPPATSRSAAGFARFSRDSPQREISPVSAFSHLRRSALALAISSLRKQKSRLFCNFFAIADPSLFLQSLNELFPLHFRASIGDWGLCDNPQSQKSCSSDRFSVFDFQDSSRAVLVRLDPARH